MPEADKRLLNIGWSGTLKRGYTVICSFLVILGWNTLAITKDLQIAGLMKY